MCGKEAGMTVLGWLEEDNLWQSIDDSDNPHVRRGGLKKTHAGLGCLTCSDASRLFSMKSGAVSMRLCLPYDISSGVYEPLSGVTSHLSDMLLWGVNVGDFYIAQPGFYAALTPSGIEFTVWSSAGRFTIKDSSTNYTGGDDVVIKFMWNRRAKHTFEEATFAISVNGVVTAWDSVHIAPDSLKYIYSVSSDLIDDEDTVISHRHAEFWALDSPSRKHGLPCTLRRIECYGSIPRVDQVSWDFSSSSSSSSDEHSHDMYMAKATLPFDFIASPGNKVDIDQVEFATVAKRRLHLNSGGPGGHASDVEGQDSGKPDGERALPEAPTDLPPGFEEVHNIS